MTHIQYGPNNHAYLVPNSGEDFIVLPGGVGSYVEFLLAKKNKTVSAFGPHFHPALDCPDLLEQTHLAHVQAGASVVIAQTFGVEGYRLRDVWREACYDRAEKITEKATGIARKVQANTPGQIVVAGSMTSLGDCYKFWQTPPRAILEREHEIGVSMLGSYCDMLWVETLPSVEEAEVIARIALKKGIPMLASFVVRADGRVSDGSPMSAVFNRLGKYPNVVGFGLNCSPVAAIKAAAGELSQVVAAQTNSGDPLKKIIAIGANGFIESREENKGGGTEGHNSAHKIYSPHDFLDQQRDILRNRWVSAIGGCCGTTPDHIRHISQKCAELSRVNTAPAYAPALAA